MTCRGQLKDLRSLPLHLNGLKLQCHILLACLTSLSDIVGIFHSMSGVLGMSYIHV